jgi:hypothetical protein
MSDFAVGLIVDSRFVPAWAHQMIVRLEREAPMVVKLVIAVHPHGRHERTPVGFRLYRAIDRRLFRVRPDALEPCDIHSALPHREWIQTTPVRRGDHWELDESVVDTLVATRVHVLVNLTGLPFGGPVLDALPCGIVAPEFGASGLDPTWLGIREVRTNAPVHQYVSIDTASGRVRASGPVATASHPWSLGITRNRVLWATGEQLHRALLALAAEGGETTASPDRPGGDRRGETSSPAASPYVVPSPRELTSLVTGVGARGLRRTVERLRTRERWVIGYRRISSASPPFTDPGGYQVIGPPPGHFYADPFVLTRDERHYLFFEDYHYATKKGVIACAELTDHGPAAPPEPVLERNHHLSYPCVFEHGDSVYMLPETSASNAVKLYRAVSFPWVWQDMGDLISDIRAFDVTLLALPEKLWLFASVGPPGASTSNQLHLFSSTDLLGPWRPHPRNPVVADVRCARPAGRLFHWNGQMIRPAQDSSLRYGRSISFRRIETIDEEEYRETEMGQLLPVWHPEILATHTYNFDARYEVVDGLLRERRWPGGPGRKSPERLSTAPTRG